MKYLIYSNLNNMVGLQRDYEIVRALLESAGHEVIGVHMFDHTNLTHADRLIFLEVMDERVMSYAREIWLVCNPEWTNLEYVDLFPQIHKVLTKTQDAQRIFKRYCPTKTEFVGFESVDLYDESIERVPEFLHVIGKSRTKNSQAVFEAWRTGFMGDAKLTVICDFLTEVNPIQNVTLLKRVSEEELKRIMNRCQFHICASTYEGFGHVINESYGVGAIVITTNAPPMNEGVAPKKLLVTPLSQVRHNLGTLNYTTGREIADCCQLALKMPEAEIAFYSHQAREYFLQQKKSFRERFLALANDPIHIP